MSSAVSSFASKPLLIDMWSDFVCPFCSLGKKKLDIIMADLGVELIDAGNGSGLPATFAAATTSKGSGAQVAYIRYHAFQLTPDCEKVYSESLISFLSQRFGTPEAAIDANFADMAKQAAAIGLTFNYMKCRVSNTFDAHRLVHFSQSESQMSRGKNIASAIQQRLLKAYFSDGLAIGEESVLQKLAVEVGMDGSEVEKVLADKKLFADEIQNDIALGESLGVDSVPSFLLNGKHRMTGGSLEEMKVAIVKAMQSGH